MEKDIREEVRREGIREEGRREGIREEGRREGIREEGRRVNQLASNVSSCFIIGGSSQW